MQGYNAVLANIKRTNFENIYGDVKEGLCCDVSNGARLLWISWTATVVAAGIYLGGLDT